MINNCSKKIIKGEKGKACLGKYVIKRDVKGKKIHIYIFRIFSNNQMRITDITIIFKMKKKKYLQLLRIKRRKLYYQQLDVSVTRVTLISVFVFL